MHQTELHQNLLTETYNSYVSLGTPSINYNDSILQQDSGFFNYQDDLE